MLLVSYDFEKNLSRTRFSKFLKKYGRRIQYSVFLIRNSQRVLDNIIKEIEMKYKPSFTNSDSIVIIPICKICKNKILRYGYAKNEEEDVLFF